MSDYVDSWQQLMDEAYGLPRGSVRLSLLEAAVSLADQNGDTRRAFNARLELTKTAESSGVPEKTLAAFAWMLAQCDRYPGEFDEWTTLWAYKWVGASLPYFPGVPRKTIERTIDDLEDRFVRYGATRKPGLKLRWRAAIVMGDLDVAAELLEEWRSLPRDELSDCPACDISDEAEAHAARHDYKRARLVARPIITERYTCEVVPHTALANLLIPLLRLGRPAEARDHHDRGYRLVKRNPALLRAIGEHIAYLALTGEGAQAVKLIERHLPWSLSATQQWSLFHFDLGVRLALLRATKEGGRATVRVPLDIATELGGGRVTVSELSGWVAARLGERARRYDRRNGNDYASQIVREHEELSDVFQSS